MIRFTEFSKINQFDLFEAEEKEKSKEYKKTQNNFIKGFEYDMSVYYVYFIVYRSPSSPQKFNLYIGVKHKPGSNQNASNFFGGLRSTGNGNSFLPGSNFEQCLTTYNMRTNEIRPNSDLSWNKLEKTLYMSSCNDPQTEALKNSYAKGLFEQKPEYHPLICNNTILGIVEEAAYSVKRTLLTDYVKGIIKNFLEKVKDTAKPLSKKKESDDKEEVVKEDISISQKTGNYFLPIDLSKGESSTKGLLNFAKSSKYGYRIYVCDDMNLYAETLKEILETEKDSTLDKEGVQKTLKDVESPEKEKQHIEEIAKTIMIRHFDTLLHTFGEKKFFKTPKEYIDFLIKQIYENKHPLLNQKYEQVPQRNQPKKELFQKDNAGDAELTDEIIATYYFPKEWSKEERQKGLEAFGQGGMKGEEKDKLRALFKERQAIRQRGKKIYNNINDLYDDFEGKYAKGHEDKRKAVQNFRVISKDQKDTEHGLSFSKGTVETSFWNSKENLLEDAYSNNSNSAKKKLKELFFKYDLKVMVPKEGKGGSGTKPLMNLGIIITRDGRPYYIIKTKNNKLKEEKFSVVRQMGSNETDRKLNIIFNLGDFFELIGYKDVEPTETLKDFLFDNEIINESFEYIQEYAGVQDRIKSRTKTKEDDKVEPKQKSSEKDKPKETVTPKSSQPKQYDQLAVNFIKKLFKGSNTYGAIFFDNGRGEKKVTIEQAKEFLAAPVKKKLNES